MKSKGSDVQYSKEKQQRGMCSSIPNPNNRNHNHHFLDTAGLAYSTTVLTSKSTSPPHLFHHL